jgi:hypothetical protein
MIKRYILHVEFHWGYWPTISIHRAPMVGDRVVDGDIPGTLVGCKECSGVGLLHQPDSFAGLWPEVAGPLGGFTGFRVERDLPRGDNRMIFESFPWPYEVVYRNNTDKITGAADIEIRNDVVTKTLYLGPTSLNYKVGETVWHENRDWVVKEFVPNEKLVLFYQFDK